MFNNRFFENRAVCEIVWKNIVEWGRILTTTWRMRIACWITNAIHTHKHTHSEYVILIAFPLQKWLKERASMLRCTCIACRFITQIFHLTQECYSPRQLSFSLT